MNQNKVQRVRTIVDNSNYFPVKNQDMLMTNGWGPLARLRNQHLTRKAWVNFVQDYTKESKWYSELYVRNLFDSNFMQLVPKPRFKEIAFYRLNMTAQKIMEEYGGHGHEDRRSEYNGFRPRLEGKDMLLRFIKHGVPVHVDDIGGYARDLFDCNDNQIHSYILKLIEDGELISHKDDYVLVKQKGVESND
jgi:hypothetical protein